MSGDLQESQEVVTLEGRSVVVTKDDDGVTINGEAKVVIADVEATNGVVHVIDSVLTPTTTAAARGEVSADDSDGAASSEATAPVASGEASDAATSGEATTAAAASGEDVATSSEAAAGAASDAEENGGKEGSNPFGISDAIDEAATAPAASGEDGATSSEAAAGAASDTEEKGEKEGSNPFGSSEVTTSGEDGGDDEDGVVGETIKKQDDKEGSNPFGSSETAPAGPDKSIVELAQATDSLSTLVSVLTMANYKPVLDVLSGAGAFTVFAPTDDAFKAAGVDVEDVDAVTAVLQYHVLDGKVMSGDLQESQEVVTLEGRSVVVTKDDDGVTINGEAKVVTADVEATNGVVHIIDAVLIPYKEAAATLA
jgi:uncharacterized surface protein with fasciclin (FAS1) repeats